MGILRTNTLSGIGTDGPVFDGVTRLDTFGYVVPPVGVTSDRTLAGVTTAQGSIRFNSDSQKLEFYAQDQWWEMVIDTPALAVGSNSEAGARGLFTGGYASGAPAPKVTSNIDYVNIASTGNPPPPKRPRAPAPVSPPVPSPTFSITISHHWS